MALDWLVGILAGDGHLDDRHVEVYNSSPEIVRESLKVLEKLVERRRIVIDVYTKSALSAPKFSRQFTVHVRRPTSPWNFNRPKIRIRVSSKELVKKIKEKIESRPKSVRDYLRGFFDAEGSVDIKGRIEFKQKYSGVGKKNALKVFRMLKKLKIATTNLRVKADNLNNKKDIYFYVTDLEKFEKIIGFVDKRKLEKLKIIIKAKRNKNGPKTKIPLQVADKWEVMKKHNITYRRLGRLIAR